MVVKLSNIISLKQTKLEKNTNVPDKLYLTLTSWTLNGDRSSQQALCKHKDFKQIFSSEYLLMRWFFRGETWEKIAQLFSGLQKGQYLLRYDNFLNRYYSLDVFQMQKVYSGRKTL